MSDLVLTTSRILPLAPPDARSEPRILRFLVIAFAMTFLSVFVLLPQGEYARLHSRWQLPSVRAGR